MDINLGNMSTDKETLVHKDLHQVNTIWKGKMQFESSANDHFIYTDKLEIHGGDNSGPRPKPLILAAIGGCTGMEIAAILTKMRLEIDGLEIDVTGELSDGTPKVYNQIHVLFKVESRNQDKAKIERAILIAVDKYCGVVAMARAFATVTSEIIFTEN